MAYTKRTTGKVANKMINYAEPRAEVKSGVHCDPDYVREQFKATRELWNRNNGTQAHQIYQSFKPGEISPEKANEMGNELARRMAPNHEAVIYTHTDRHHIHNHIIINSVNMENGLKLDMYGEKKLAELREVSDQLCKENNMSLITEQNAKVRYTMAERQIIEKGGVSWKDELRQAIDYEKQNSTSYEEFKKNLTEKYNIEIREGKKDDYISYKHPDRDRAVSGKKLGLDYERGTIENEFIRAVESREKQVTGEPRGTEKPDYLELLKRGNREDSSRADLTIKQGDQDERRTERAERESLKKADNQRTAENREHQQNESVDSKPEQQERRNFESEQSKAGRTEISLSGDDRGLEETSISPDVNPESDLERESEAVLNPDANNHNFDFSRYWSFSADSIPDLEEQRNKSRTELKKESQEFDLDKFNEHLNARTEDLLESYRGFDEVEEPVLESPEPEPDIEPKMPIISRDWDMER